ncbi:MAG: hypothetical protein R3F56_16770 [Planctomycetota bacterium]
MIGINYLVSAGITILYSWNGRAWADWALRLHPPLGSDALSVCVDTTRRVIVMVRYTGSVVETWELGYNGDWTRVFPNGAPVLASTDFALHYSPSRSAALLVARTVAGPIGIYEYAGAAWQLLATTTAPTTGAANTAYDSVRNRLVLFSGSPTVADTWEWDGTDWTLRLPTNSPAARVSTSITFDSLRGRCILAGGAATDPNTWEWDGSNWQPNLTSRLPAMTMTARMAHDARRGRVVLVRTDDPAETWEYFVPSQATYTTFGASCLGSGAYPPSLRAVSPRNLPWLGDTLTCYINAAIPTVSLGLLGVSNQSWQGIPLPFDAAAIGASGCTLYTSIDARIVLPLASGTWDLPIPNTVSLKGARFYQQGLVLDSAANRLGAVLTNAAVAVIGDH